MHKLYFAYGSNMNPNQMKKRCPHSKAIAKARLRGFRLAINSRGVATVVNDSNKYVSGVVWQISAKDEAMLDVYEGVKAGVYSKKIVSVSFGNNRTKEALIYVDKNTYSGTPRVGYLEKIINGAKFFGLDKSYITNLERLKYEA